LKLYWKIYLFLAATTLVTLFLSFWISFSVLPSHFERQMIRQLDDFQEAVVNRPNLTRTDVLLLADSLAIDVRFFLDSTPPPMMPAQCPPGERDWRGVRIIRNQAWNFTILASKRVASPQLFLLIPLALGLFLSQALALALGLRSVFRRTSILTRITSDFGEGNLSARYPGQGNSDEIDILGSTFNLMAERIISLLGSHNELLNSVAHELRTPMARLGFAIELAKENPETVKEKLGLLERDLFELDRLVSELLEFNRIGSSSAIVKEPVSLLSICLEAADGERKPNSAIEITVVSDGQNFTVTGDHRLLLRAVSNLLRNAVHYAKKTIEVRVNSTKDCVVVSVSDDGPGFLPGFTDKASNPFVKGYDSKGSGLGLSIVNRIAERHGGTLSLSNIEGSGARAVLHIPV
jgi:signal transduction histidine kinase